LGGSEISALTFVASNFLYLRRDASRITPRVAFSNATSMFDAAEDNLVLPPGDVVILLPGFNKKVKSPKSRNGVTIVQSITAFPGSVLISVRRF
jgi:hypothetical protein